MPKLLSDIFEERYAAVIVCDTPPDEKGNQPAFAYGPEQECPFCEEDGRRAWEFYSGVVYYESARAADQPQPQFDEHAAERMVGDCRGGHDDEPRDAAGALMRP